jgi:hypothetical protein
MINHYLSCSRAGLFITLLACVLVPVDVFLISYMKNPDGKISVFCSPPSVQTFISVILLVWSSADTGYVLASFKIILSWITLQMCGGDTRAVVGKISLKSNFEEAESVSFFFFSKSTFIKRKALVF